MRIAFLGLGKMGSAIAHHLKNGHKLTVWNRTAGRADAFRKEGIRVAENPAAAVKAAEVVFTAVIDDKALDEVLQEQGVLTAMEQDAIHVSLSTISVAFSRRLTEEHRRHHKQFVAAPVFGRPNIAEDAKLWVAIGGQQAAIETVRPLIEKFSRGNTIVSDQPWSAHAVKLGGNFLITAMIASLSEALVYAEAEGVQPAVFLETINKGLFQSPFYESYGKIMLNPPEKPGGTMALGEKDTRLFLEAAQAGQVSTPLGDIFHAHLKRGIAQGMKDEDWAAGYYKLTREMTRKQD